MQRLFFYGLFMDQDLLTASGVSAKPVGLAALDGFRLTIGRRATLVPDADARVFGRLMDLTASDTAALYAGPGLAGYQPQTVTVDMLHDGLACEAIVYNLPANQVDSDANLAYARKLRALAIRLNLPRDYVDSVIGGSD